MQSVQVTDDIKMEVIKYLGYEDCKKQKDFYFFEAPDDLFIFYYNCMMNGLDVCDGDRYANLNTVFGYDVGMENFKKLDCYLWCEKDYDLMDLFGNNDNKQIIEDAVNHLNIDIDFSKWNNEEVKSYVYYV